MSRLRLNRIVVLLFAVSLALPVRAAEKNQAWQALMQKGSMAHRHLHFEEARAHLKDALESTKSSSEEGLFSSLLMGKMFEDIGRYEDAEKCYRQALTFGRYYDAEVALADVLEKQNKRGEASKVRSETSYVTAAEDAEFQKLVKSTLHPKIGANWRASVLPKNLNVMMYAPPQTMAPLGWNTVVFAFNPKSLHPVGFIRSTSGDTKTDNAALAALENLQIKEFAERLPKPFLLEYRFGQGGSKSGLANHPTLEDDYQFAKQLLTWQQTNLGADHLEVALTLSYAADCLRKMEQFDAAVKALEAATKICQQKGVRCSKVVEAFRRYGICLAKLKRYEEAENALRLASSMAAEIFPENSTERVDCDEALADALDKTGKRAEAKEIRARIDRLKHFPPSVMGRDNFKRSP